MKKLENIKAVLFDLDGTLFDSEVYQDREFLRAMHSGGYTDFTFDSISGSPGMSLQEFQHLVDLWLQKNYGVTYDYFLKQTNHHQYDNIPFKDIINPGVKEFIEYLKKKGIKMAICSSSTYEYIEIAAKDANITDYFDLFLSGYDLKHSKPYPDIYLLAMDKLGLKPSECIVIEDSKNGILAGKRAGCYTFAYHVTKYDYDQSDADCIVESFKEIENCLYYSRQKTS